MSAKLATLIVLLSSLPALAEAQRLTDSRAAYSASPRDSVRKLTNEASEGRKFVVRASSSLLASVTGAVAGYALGSSFTPKNRDYYFLSEQQGVGLAVGYFVGAAYGAAAHSYSSNCSFTKRMLIGLAGGLVGTIPGMIVGPLGPSMGAALFMRAC